MRNINLKKTKIIFIAILLIIDMIVFFSDKGTYQKIDFTSRIKTTAELGEKYWGNQFYGYNPKKIENREVEGISSYAPSLYELSLPAKKNGKLRFKYGINDDASTQGNGMIFEVYLQSKDGPKKIFQDTVLPVKEISVNKIHSGEIDLERLGKKRMILLFATNDNGNNAFDQGFWSNVEYSFLSPALSRATLAISLLLTLAVVYFEKIRDFWIKNKLSVFLVFLITFGFLYLYLATQGTYGFHEYRQGAYYSWLADKFDQGRLSSNITSGEHGGDFSYFNGKKYLYFGPLPAVLHWTYYKAFDGVIYGSILTYIFALVNLFLFWLLLTRVKNEFFRQSSSFGIIVFFITYASGTLMFCISRPFVYEESIIIGSTFLLASLCIFLDYYLKDRSSYMKLFCGGIFMTLAFFSRYTLILYSVIPFFIIVSKLWKEKEKEYRKEILKALFAFTLPVIIGIGVIFCYNYLRFQNVLEFGISYQEPGSEEDFARIKNGTMNSLAYVPYNIYHYFFAWPSTHKVAPRLISTTGHFPKLTASDYCSSVFLNFPLLFFVFYYFCYKHLKFSKDPSQKKLAQVSAIFFIGLILTILYLSTFAGNSRRYVQDFLPFLTLIAFAGFQSFYNEFSKKIILLLIIPVILLYTLFINTWVSCDFTFTGHPEKCLNVYNTNYILLN